MSTGEHEITDIDVARVLRGMLLDVNWPSLVFKRHASGLEAVTLANKEPVQLVVGLAQPRGE